MKKMLFAGIFFLLMLTIAQTASARVLRVYYFGTSVPGTDFTTPQAAHDAATAGDTVEIYPNPGVNGVTCTKRLIWIGVGYFIDGTGNPGLQVYISPSILSSVTLNLGTDGTVITGLQIPTITINGATSNHLFKRNNITSNIQFNANTTGVSILQNVVAQISSLTGVSTSNINISNNIVTSLVNLNNGTSSGLLSNNVFTSNVFQLGTFIVQNNILVNNFSITCNTCTYLNNLGPAAQFPVGNGNQQSVVMANVFVGTGSNDAKWKLKPGSPAIGAGQGGIDCGPYGGTDPYVLSGIPTIPSIYQLAAPGGTTVSGATMNVNISTRGN